MPKSKNQKGVIVIEATIVVTIVVVFIAILFYIGMLLYQQAQLTTAANNAASSIAQTYSNEMRDPFTGYIDADRVYQSASYSKMKDDALLRVMEQKANVFTMYRLKSSTILTPQPEVDVQIVHKENELLKSQIIVTVTDSYTVPLVGFFGANNKITYTATGRADCVSLLDYIHSVDTIGDPENSPVQTVDDKNWLVLFVPDRDTARVTKRVPVLANHSIVTSNRYTHSVMPTNPVNGDLRFNGWVDEYGRSFTATTPVERTMTVYGKWLCTVSFDACGSENYPASVNPGSISVEINQTVHLPTPHRNGNYTFLGWFTEKEGKGQQYASNVTSVESNVTLYAHWRCDHDIQVVETIQASCIVKEKTVKRCKQCGYQIELAGDLGPHQWGEWSEFENATICTERQKSTRRCKICNLEDVRYGGVGEHKSGRCGKQHTCNVNITSHAGKGYNYSYSVECIVCERCGQPIYVGGYYGNGWIERTDTETKETIKMTKGVYCYKHVFNGKKNKAIDESYVKNYAKRNIKSIH